jgi:hypothetical protein
MVIRAVVRKIEIEKKKEDSEYPSHPSLIPPFPPLPPQPPHCSLVESNKPYDSSSDNIFATITSCLLQSTYIPLSLTSIPFNSSS